MATHNGYVITPRAEDALDAFDRDGVRHVAELASGEGIVCYSGCAVPPVSGTVLLDQSDDVWPWAVVRHIAPASSHEPEHFALFTAAEFGRLSSVFVQQATPVGCDLILALTYGPEPGALWQSTVLRYMDKRVTLDPALA